FFSKKGSLISRSTPPPSHIPFPLTWPRLLRLPPSPAIKGDEFEQDELNR
ncbi:unnamed protein product, partial [Arabidopsis halleri]